MMPERPESIHGPDCVRRLVEKSSRPPEHVQAWQIAVGPVHPACIQHDTSTTPCALIGHEPSWWQDDPLIPVPDRDSAEYAWGLVTAADQVIIGTLPYLGPRTYRVTWTKGSKYAVGDSPDPVSALIAAVLASKGGEK